MIRKLINQLLILMPAIIVLIIMSLLWDKIKFEFMNPNEIIGYYSIFKHSYLNDNVRYICFVGFPLLTYFISKILVEKVSFKNIKNILKIEENITIENQFSKTYLIFFFLILLFFLLSYDFNKNPIDLFHEGQAISGALNFEFNKGLWSESFVITGLFVDILNANISWNLFENQSLSSYRFFIKIINLVTTSTAFIFLYQFINSSNLSKNLKIISFIIFCFHIFFLFENQTLGYRELPVFIFLIFSYNLIVLKKTNIFIYLILGFLPVFSLLWSLDRGIFILAIYVVFFGILFFNKKFKELLTLSLIILFSLILLISIIGTYEFNHFITNSLEILSSSDLLNGIIHPEPFSNDNGSSRATKSLLIIIINGIILINYLINKKTNLDKNFKIYILLYYIFSLIFYKIGVTRSDGGHIKQGVSLNMILFYYFIIINIFSYFEKKGIYLNLKNNLLSILSLTILLTFIFLNTPKNSLNNLFTFKERLTKYLNTSDLEYLNKQENILISKLKHLNKNEKCIQIFTYETAISYFLNKPTCTKFYHIMNMGPKKNQIIFINQLKNTKPKYILTEGTYKKIGNMKGRNEDELSPKVRFPYIENFINENYKKFETFEDWEILVKR